MNNNTFEINHTNIKEFLNSIRTNSFAENYPHHQLIITSYAEYPIINNKEYTSILSNYQLFPYSNDYRSLLSRLLLHPTREILSAILQMINIEDFHNCIGIQIRMGGNNAASKENFVFLSSDAVINNIQKFVQKYKTNEKIYLSTDSLNILPKVKELLKEHEVLQFSKYTVGHSSSIYRNKTLDSIKRAISDAIAISNCKTIYLTNYSSYGHLISWLSSRNTKKYLMYNMEF